MAVSQRSKKSQLSAVANHRDKNEKASYIRKKKNLEALIEASQPNADLILSLTLKHTLMLSDLYSVRDTLFEKCMHFEQLENKCAFCRVDTTNIPAGKKSKSWDSEVKVLETLVEKANELSDNLLLLREAQLLKIEEIMQLREVMVKDCIHPADHLVHFGTHIRCKFCETKLSIPKI